MIEGVQSSTTEISDRRLTIRTVGRWDDRCDGRTVFRWEGETVGGGCMRGDGLSRSGERTVGRCHEMKAGVLTDD